MGPINLESHQPSMNMGWVQLGDVCTWLHSPFINSDRRLWDETKNKVSRYDWRLLIGRVCDDERIRFVFFPLTNLEQRNCVYRLMKGSVWYKSEVKPRFDWRIRWRTKDDGKRKQKSHYLSICLSTLNNHLSTHLPSAAIAVLMML